METTINTPAVKDQKEFQEKLDAIKAGIKARREAEQAESFTPPKDEEETPSPEESKQTPVLDRPEDPKPKGPEEDQPKDPEEDQPKDPEVKESSFNIFNEEYFSFEPFHIKIILALLVRDKGFYETYGPWVHPHDFATVTPLAPNDGMMRIFLIAQDYFTKFKGPIKKEILKSEIQRYCKDFKKADRELTEWNSVVDEIFDIGESDLDVLKEYYASRISGVLQIQGAKLSMRDFVRRCNANPKEALSEWIKELTKLKEIDLKEEFSGITFTQGLNLKIDEPDWIVKPIIERGDKGYMVATYKVGKTLLFQQLTLCLSKAIPFLGFEIPKPRKVVYLRFELKDEKFWKRYLKMNVWEWNKPLLKDPYFELRRGFNISSKDEKDLQWLFRLIDKQEPELLLLDPLYKMTDLNLADPKSGILLRYFEKLQDRYPDLTIELAHHKAKTYKEKESESWDSSYGIFQLFADMDHEMRISRASNEFKWDFITNNEPVDSLVLERDPNTLIYKPLAQGKIQKKALEDEANLEKMDTILRNKGKINKTTFRFECAKESIGEDLFGRLSPLGKDNFGWIITKVKNQTFYEPGEQGGGGQETEETPAI